VMNESWNCMKYWLLNEEHLKIYNTMNESIKNVSIILVTFLKICTN
jgi:hypothetical protein